MAAVRRVLHFLSLAREMAPREQEGSGMPASNEVRRDRPVSDGAQPEAERAKPRGEAGWKAHLQAIANSNEKVRSVARRQRQEREELAARQRAAEERRVEAEFARNLDPRYSN